MRKCFLSNPTLYFFPWYLAFIYRSSLSLSFSLGLLNSLVSPSHSSFLLPFLDSSPFCLLLFCSFLPPLSVSIRVVAYSFAVLTLQKKKGFFFRIYHPFAALGREGNVLADNVMKLNVTGLLILQCYGTKAVPSDSFRYAASRCM